MMAWLISQHDMATLMDASSVKFLSSGRNLPEQFVVQVGNVAQMWNGADPSKFDMSAIWMDAGSPG
jgi:hypothetical protein